jgi:hypothetical protein
MAPAERVGGASPDSGGIALRDAWHPRLQRLHQYWLDIHPTDGLPGRQHVDPIDIPDLLSNLWLLEVQREPFRLRYRLAGTSIVYAAKREVTGQWLDDVRPQVRTIPGYFDRYRAIVETKEPSWRRGPPNFQMNAYFVSLQNLFLPLARDGRNVDMILAGTVYFRFDNSEF